MRIGLVTMRTDPARGGAERYTIDLAEALALAGHDVSLVASSLVAIPPGVTGVQMASRALTRTRRYERFLDSLDSHLEHAGYDIVHAMLPVRRCDVYHPHAGLARAMVANDSRLTRLLNPRRGRGAAIEGRLLESADPPVVLCLSDYVKRAVRQWYDLPETHLPILFNAVDLQRYDPESAPGAREQTRARQGVSDDQCLAAFVGHDYDRKGLREAILALGRLMEQGGPIGPRLKLLIVGRPSADRYLAVARQLGVADQVLEHGHTDDTSAIYRAADFLVLPTKHDPCSLVVLEGLAMGLPVISTRFNGACEIMTDGVHGFVLDDPADIDSLASAMRAMLDGTRRTRMSSACLELRPMLAYEKHLRTLLSIYQQVIGRKTSSVAGRRGVSRAR